MHILLQYATVYSSSECCVSEIAPGISRFPQGENQEKLMEFCFYEMLENLVFTFSFLFIISLKVKKLGTRTKQFKWKNWILLLLSLVSTEERANSFPVQWSAEKTLNGDLMMCSKVYGVNVCIVALEGTVLRSWFFGNTERSTNSQKNLVSRAREDFSPLQRLELSLRQTEHTGQVV